MSCRGWSIVEQRLPAGHTSLWTSHFRTDWQQHASVVPPRSEEIIEKKLKLADSFQFKIGLVGWCFVMMCENGVGLLGYCWRSDDTIVRESTADLFAKRMLLLPYRLVVETSSTVLYISVAVNKRHPLSSLKSSCSSSTLFANRQITNNEQLKYTTFGGLPVKHRLHLSIAGHPFLQILHRPNGKTDNDRQWQTDNKQATCSSGNQSTYKPAQQTLSVIPGRSSWCLCSTLVTGNSQNR